MVVRDDEERIIIITDLGVTMRTIMAVAATGYSVTGKRRWRIQYKQAIIGKVSVSTKEENRNVQYHA